MPGRQSGKRRRRGRANQRQDQGQDQPQNETQPQDQGQPQIKNQQQAQCQPRDQGQGPSRQGTGNPNRPVPSCSAPNLEKKATEMRVSEKPMLPIVNSKKGIAGTAIKLKTNYFKLITRPKWVLFQYRVDVSPEEETTRVRRSLMKVHKHKIGGYLFDGTVLYTANRLNPEPLVLYSKKDNGETAALTLKLVGDVTEGDYVYIQLFNILMRKCYRYLKLRLMGRDFFDQAEKVDIKDYKLQIWPGYKTTIAQYETSILMVTEICHKVVRMDTVHDVLRNARSAANYRDAFNKEVIGQVVLTDYNNRTYKVDDVDWGSTPNSTFAINGKMVSFTEYYRNKYGLNVVDDRQPMLVSRAKQRDIRRGGSETIMLVPQFCRMTGLTDKMRSDFRLMKNLANCTMMSPESRMRKCLQFCNRLLSNAECKAELNQWDMKLDSDLLELNARILPQEMILQAATQYPAGNAGEGWGRSLRQNKLVAIANVERWAVICSVRFSREVRNFVALVIKNGAAMHFNLPQPTFYEIPNDNVGSYMSMAERVLSTSQPNIVLFVIPTNRNDSYNAIKKKCSVDRAVPTQVITNKTLTNKSLTSIADKVVVQMNSKMGGTPWAVHTPLDDLMVIGYDVCHDPKNKSKSYGAMVCSLDKCHTKYYSCVANHNQGEELSNEFGLNVKKALNVYKRLHGKYPGTVFIYRDGVGEGQLSYVYEHEVKTIKEVFASIYGDSYKLCFIVVSKRLNTRFFYGNYNPIPGTVVDDQVTSPDRYDFFLVSQAVREGSVTPTSYNVLYDSSTLGPDKIQRMTFKMCHIYYNFSGPVRVPAHCQYAHKLAFLSSQCLSARPNESLANKLHFL